MDEAARAALIEGNVGLVHRIARNLHPRVRDYIDRDELVAVGNVGLAEAASRYDPTAGAAFTTFAYYRVQGAMLDHVRRQSNLPRRVWRQLVALRGAAEYLENRSDRDAGARAQGAGTPSTADQLRAIKSAMAAIKVLYVTSLDAMIETGGDVRDDDAPDVGRELDLQRLRGRLGAAIAALPDRERALLEKHYYEGKNLLEAGAELGISKSWASRLHAQAVDRLREHLGQLPARPPP